MEQGELIDHLVGKFETWADSLTPEERGLLSGVLSRLSGNDVQGYSADLLLSSNLLGNQLRDLLLLGCRQCFKWWMLVCIREFEEALSTAEDQQQRISLSALAML